MAAPMAWSKILGAAGYWTGAAILASREKPLKKLFI